MAGVILMTNEGQQEHKGVGGGFSRCESCNYEGGFHLLLDPVGEGEVKVRLKCPNCYKVYDRDIFFLAGENRRR